MHCSTCCEDAPVSGPTETALRGGTANRGLVFRVGDTVRRPQGPGQAAVHALLVHLEQVGFDGAPRFLGVDAQGREVLSYLPGQTALPPYPPWSLTPRALRSVARLLRGFHQATVGFDAAQHSWALPLPPRFRGDLVTHNDPNLDNIVFRSGEAVALIDFDRAAPGTPAWDVASAARTWAPLRPDQDIPDGRRGQVLARFRQLVHDYGLAGQDHDLLVAALLQERDWMYDLVQQGAEQGAPGFADYWTPDVAARAARARGWCIDHQAQLRAALA